MNLKKNLIKKENSILGDKKIMEQLGNNIDIYNIYVYLDIKKIKNIKNFYYEDHKS